MGKNTRKNSGILSLPSFPSVNTLSPPQNVISSTIECPKKKTVLPGARENKEVVPK